MTKITREQLNERLKTTMRNYEIESKDFDNLEDLLTDLLHDLWIDFEVYLDQEKESEYEDGIAQGKKEATYMR